MSVLTQALSPTMTFADWFEKEMLFRDAGRSIWGLPAGSVQPSVPSVHFPESSQMVVRHSGSQRADDTLMKHRQLQHAVQEPNWVPQSQSSCGILRFALNLQRKESEHSWLWFVCSLRKLINILFGSSILMQSRSAAFWSSSPFSNEECSFSA